MLPADLNTIQTHAEAIISTAIDLNDRCRCKGGGFLCIASHTGEILHVELIGEIYGSERIKICHCFCQEKAIRLASNPAHISSWQSREEAQQKYGGAIRAERYIYSFSNFPEWWDEACMVALAEKLEPNGFPIQLIRKIRKISGNPYIDVNVEPGVPTPPP